MDKVNNDKFKGMILALSLIMPPLSMKGITEFSLIVPPMSMKGITEEEWIEISFSAIMVMSLSPLMNFIMMQVGL